LPIFILAVTFSLRILISGSKGETPVVSTDLENETINLKASRAAGMVQAEEKN
jgi:hypothetical protein